MRKLFVILLIGLIGYQGIGQKTKVVVLDLGPPHEDSFVIYDCEKPIENGILNESCKKEEKQKLRINSNNLLSFQIINTNPYRYRYTLRSSLKNLYLSEQAKFVEKFTTIEDISIPKAKSNALEAETEDPINSIMASINDSPVDAKELTAAVQDNSEILERQKEAFKEEILAQEQKIEQFATRSSDSNFKIELDENKIARDGILVKKKGLIKNLEELNNLQKAILNTKEKKSAKITMYKEQNRRINTFQKELTNLRDDEARILFDQSKLTVLIQTKRMKDLDFLVGNYLKEIGSKETLKFNTFLKKKKEYNRKLNTIKDELDAHTSLRASKLTKEYTDKYNSLVNEKYKPQLENVTKKLKSIEGLKEKHYTLPISFDGDNIDVIELSIERTPRLEKKAQAPDPIVYKIWVTGGLKIDVSAGVFLSSLVNREYEIFDAPSESDGQTDPMDPMVMGEEENLRVIDEINRGRYEYGFGTIANITWRCGTWVKPTLNFGVMLTTEQRFQFLLGGGVILGKMDRFVFHGGISVGRVTTLNDRLVADGATTYEADQLPQNLNVEQLKIGHFFGVTYNLGKTKTESTN